MRVVRLAGPRDLRVEHAPEPEPGAGEVSLAIAACGICGSDLSCFKTGVFAGSVLGHEIAGEVIESHAPGWEPGDRVVLDPKIPCGNCPECDRGASHLCIAALTTGVGQSEVGGFAERAAIPAACLHRVPDAMDPVTACLAEPLAVTIHGLNLAGDAAGPAVVFGLGPIGVLAVAALTDRDVTPVLGVDPVASRRALAVSVGAADAVEPGDPAIGGARPALAIETSGHAIPEAGNVCAPGGTVLLLGIPMGEVPVWPMVWITKELRLLGSIGQTQADFAAAIDLLARKPALGALVTERIGLEDVPSRFARLATEPGGGKIVVVP